MQGGYEEKGMDFGGFEEVVDSAEEVFGNRPTHKAYRGEDIHTSITIPFLEAAKGGRATVVFDRMDVCSTCNGTKVRAGATVSRCTNCGGRGVIFFRRGAMSVQATCSKCQGAGTVLRQPCIACNGTGISTTQASEYISIPAGVDTGQTLRAAGRGHRSEGEGPSGDLLVKVTVKPHPMYRRAKYDVYMTVRIPISKAVLGGVVSVDTIQGKTEVKLAQGEDFGSPKCLSGKGIQHLPPDVKKIGDCYVSFVVQIPTKLTARQLSLFQQLVEEDSSSPAQFEGFFTQFLHRKP